MLKCLSIRSILEDICKSRDAKSYGKIEHAAESTEISRGILGGMEKTKVVPRQYLMLGAYFDRFGGIVI